ncbi:MAG: CPBP family intramembrane glutamic endopeptidase [Bacteroidota bacterium]
MLGLLVLLLVSWGLLFLFERKDLRAIGILPCPKHLIHWLLGMTLIVVFCLTLIGIETRIKTVEWNYQGLRFGLLLDAFVYHLRSALTEDLVFRGALLYLLIRRLGARWGILLSAICFGIYHVFSYGITGERWILIAYVILITGTTGWVWAYVFHKTRSIYLGLGLHIGYNLVMSCFYEAPLFGELLFSAISSTELSEPGQSFYTFFRGLFTPIATLATLVFLFRHPWFKARNISE